MEGGDGGAAPGADPMEGRRRRRAAASIPRSRTRAFPLPPPPTRCAPPPRNLANLLELSASMYPSVTRPGGCHARRERRFYPVDAVGDHFRARAASAAVVRRADAAGPVVQSHLGLIPLCSTLLLARRVDATAAVDVFLLMLAAHVGDSALNHAHRALRPVASFLPQLWGRSRMVSASAASRFLAALDDRSMDAMQTLFCPPYATSACAARAPEARSIAKATDSRSSTSTVRGRLCCSESCPTDPKTDRRGDGDKQRPPRATRDESGPIAS